MAPTSAKKSQTSAKSPGGVAIFGWAGTLFCALLAFYNATVTTNGGLRILFLVGGAGLVGVLVTLVSRWYIRRRRTEAHESD